jgi:HK97 family phage major capsid protein
MWIQLKQAYFGMRVGKRIDCDETHAKMLVEKGIAEPLQGNPLGDVIKQGMTSLVEGMTKGTDQAIQDTLKSFHTAQQQTRKHTVPAIFGAGGEGDPKKNFGDWLLCVGQVTFGKSQKAKAEPSDRLEKVYSSMFQPWQKAALAESSGVTGGYVVPPEFYQQLLQIASEESTFRQRAFY